MARVKVNFPDDNSLFHCQVKVRINDLNYGGHIGNDSILSIIHESRMQMLRSWDMTELNTGYGGLIMADVAIAYKNQGFYGDILDIDIWAEEITSRSFDLLYRLRVWHKGKPKEIAHAKTGMVVYNYSENKIGQMGERLRKKLERVD